MNVRLPAHERRRQLLDVALDVFAADGFHSTSMNDVAEAAGVTKPVLYQHFASKRQLYLELLTPKLGRVYAEIQSFRMEPDADDRHLCQFSLFEIEHLGNLDELIGHISGIVQAAAR